MQLVKKYISWVDPEAGNEELQQYADFYCGKWIGPSKISRLARKGRDNRIFNSHVMKNFFEESLHRASYSAGRKFIVASVLSTSAGYGSFFFRVLKNTLFKKSV